MIYKDEVISMIEAKDPFDGCVCIQVCDDNTIEESNGSASFKSEKNKSGKPDINIRYAPAVAHKNKIRVKVSDTGDFVDKSKYSEVVFLYDSKEYFYQSIRKMTDTEEKYVLGFVSRYEDALDSNTRDGGIDSKFLTPLIDDDMESNFLIKKGKYKPYTGRIDLIKNNGEYNFEVSNSPVSEYIHNPKKDVQ